MPIAARVAPLAPIFAFGTVLISLPVRSNFESRIADSVVNVPIWFGETTGMAGFR